ncbi:ROK family protein [Halobacillus litoralis]|uniref:ROK family protein n=1 Tax=Halobacillus litoralis TaxID=45668 RepID=UPI001CD59643|nr:ROK family protein [Halobacillus litoralis]MCA0970584.1 ROK family protein [Halobacillus litoralis]
MQAIGVDLGGTSIKGRLFDDEWQVIEGVTVPTEVTNGKDGILQSLSEVLDKLVAAADSLIGIGVGSAGRIDVKMGRVVYATGNLPGWHGFLLKEWVEERYGVPAVIENDANAALLGERFLTEVPEHEDIVLLTLGTGVGGANYFSGQIVRGAHHQSGEWGHTILYPGGRPCNCGNKGCVEQYVSGTAIRRSAEEQTHEPFSHGRDVFERMHEDNRLKGIVDQFVDDLVIVIQNLANGIDPDRIILGGGVVESHSYWWNDLQYALKNQNIKTIVSRAQQRNKAGMYGAAFLAWQRWKEGRQIHETT